MGIQTNSENPICLQAESLSYTSFAEKKFEHEIVRSFDLSVQKGEIVALYGPNGCGKTTIIRCLVGIQNPSSGNVYPNMEQHESRRPGYVPQDYGQSLLPWKNVIDNIGLPLSLTGMKKKDIHKRVMELMETFSLEVPLYSYPYKISGGEKQKTALARALITSPKVLVLDEPFSALDYDTKRQMLDKLVEIWKKTQLAILFTSHTVDDAISIADRIIILSRRPATVFEQIDFPNQRKKGSDFLNTTDSLNFRRKILSSLEEARRQ